MIKSMTGYGRCEVIEGDEKFTVELKSVNHRYLDVNIRIPKKLNFFETSIRKLLKNYASRGKIDIFVTYEKNAENQLSLKYNEALAKEYMMYFKQMSDNLGIENDIRVSAMSRYPEVLVMEEQSEDIEELWIGLEKACVGAFSQFVETRTKEGENLLEDMNQKLDVMLDKVALVEERSPDVVSEYCMKIEEKVKELLEDTQIDESRIATEIVIFSEKICTDEEVVRLRSHIEQVKSTLNNEEGVGRKLDFIAQEMNREANTILSKANDLVISNYAIDIKTEIEKIREQIQNIE